MISFGKRIEMMVDNYLLSELKNVSFRCTKPENHGKVLGFENLWEGEGSATTSALYDGQDIKLYYRGFPAPQAFTGQDDTSVYQVSCLATSSDGLHFQRCPVNEIDYKGIRQNNIVYMGTVCHNFAPFYDENPKCRPEERYKAIGGIKQTGGIWIFSSPDGIHWSKMADHPVITKGAFDSMNMAFWNPSTKLYHCYYRYLDNTVKTPAMPTTCRAIQSCTSPDFVHWTDPVQNVYEDGLTDQLYTNATRPVPGAEHIMVSLPMRFQEVRRKYPECNEGNYGRNGVSDAVLMTSRDGVHWDRTIKDAWISGSLYSHEWTQRCFITSGGIIPHGDRFYIYMEQNYMWDDDGIWAYSIPKYRFISLYADGNGGLVTTKTLKFETDDIYLNYSTSAYGYVKVKILDDNGKELFASDEIFGNELSHRLHIENLAGKVGVMQIELNQAHLYAMGSDIY